MDRLKATFERTRKQQKAALIPFLTAGFPSPELSLDLMHALVDGGADILEIGIPFSDPMADGPVIQTANDIALARGVTLKSVLALVRAFRESDNVTPIVLMGYLNPIEKMGYQIFAEQCETVGVDAVLTVDLPPEESHDLLHTLKNNHISPIFLISPLTPKTRTEAILKEAEGYVYTIAFKGITGADKLDIGLVASNLDALQKKTDLPIAIGFGIKSPETAAALAEHSDAVIVGSALIDYVHRQSTSDEKLIENTSAYINSFKQELGLS